MASCTGLACSDPRGCTVPGVGFGSCSLALSLAWFRGSCTWLWVGGSLVTTSLRLVGEKRKKEFINTGMKYATPLGFGVREQSLPEISFSRCRHPWGLGAFSWSLWGPNGHLSWAGSGLSLQRAHVWPGKMWRGQKIHLGQDYVFKVFTFLGRYFNVQISAIHLFPLYEWRNPNK